MKLARVGALLLLALAVLGGPAFARPTISLEGAWEYAFCDLATPPQDDAAWAPVTVPATLEARPEGPHTVWFRKRFLLPTSWSGNRIALKLDGVTYGQKAFLNGKAVGSCVGGFAPAEYDLTETAVAGEVNELAIAAQDWTALLTTGAQAALIGPVGPSAAEVGIWDHVSLELRPRVWVEDVAVLPSVREGLLQVDVTVRNSGKDDLRTRVTARISEGGGGPLFSPDEFLVPAGEAETVTLTADWPKPTLWSPQDPHLYTLVVGARTGAMADALEVRFGFREFWAQGELFYLNCAPLHLLAVSAPSVICDQSPAAFFAALKRASANAVLLGGQPWPQPWYDAADQAGVLVIAESAFVGQAAPYALTDPKLWENAQVQVSAQVKRLRNHPSIVIWSAENEVLASGGAAVPETQRHVGNLANMIRDLDPTRPVLFGGDADPAGEADIISLHRPHELPPWTQWPETASWFDAPVQLDGYPGGCWQWDRQKPLYLSDFLRIPPTDVTTATVLFGDAATLNPDLYRTLTETKLRAWQVIAARAAGVSGVAAWTADQIADPGSPALAAMRRAYRPLAVFDLSANTEIFAGKVTERTLALVNDSGAARQILLQWRLVPAVGTWKLEGGQQLALPPAGRAQVRAVLALPPLEAERVKATFTLDLCEAGRLVFSESLPWTVFGNAPLSGRVRGAPKQVAIYDPKGETTRLLAEVGIGAAPFNAQNLRQVLCGRDVAVLGKCALADPCTPTGAMLADLLSFVRGGGTLLVFEQPQYPEKLIPTPLTSQSATIAFARDTAHPALKGLMEQDLAHWLPDGVVSVNEMEKPLWGGFRAITDSGGPAGLGTAGLAEVRLGKGRILLNQLDLTAKYGADPVATRLVRNLLAYAGTRPAPVGPIGVLLDPPAPRQLAQLSVAFARLLDGLGRAPLSRYRALIISDPGRVESCATELRAYVRHGGRVVFHNLTPANFQAAASIVGVPIELYGATDGAIVLTNRTSMAAGMSNDDLAWFECDPTTGAMTRSAGVADYAIDLSGVKQAVVHTTPGVLASLHDGRGLWVIDQVRWDAPGANQDLALRYLNALVMNLGGEFAGPGGAP